MSEDKNEVFLVGEGRHGTPGALRTEDDRTLRTWSLQVAQDATGAERLALVENDRTARSQLVLWETATPGQIRWRAEDTTGEACVSNYGQDEAGTLDPLRTDPNRILWTRAHDEWIDVSSREIPAAEADLWNPALADTTRFMVEFNVVANDAGEAAAEGIYVGREIDSAGGLARPYYWMFDWTVPYPGESGWQGPFYMHGDDAIRGVADVANDASIHFRVRRVDVGA